MLTHWFAVLLVGVGPADYPPCTAELRDRCIQQQPEQWPTLYIPCPPNTYCPPYDIPRYRRPYPPPPP